MLCPGAQVAREPTTQPCLTQVVRVTSTGGPRNGEPARSPHGALPCTACRPCVFTGSPCLLPSCCGALSGPAGSSAPGHPHDVGENGDFSCPQVGFELIVPFLFGILKCINKKQMHTLHLGSYYTGQQAHVICACQQITTLERQCEPASCSSPLELWWEAGWGGWGRCRGDCLMRWIFILKASSLNILMILIIDNPTDFKNPLCLISVQFSCSVTSDSATP